ncbi:hypothetical protein GCM10009733_080290 [Nonomuraea maheshkhaliensis]|uniref:Uncharacterized protein n=1 Tax=Nonomuraea maheshkhaliensis TaxID=419590 RepID=A0ABN2GGL0_9ACTN
MDLTAPAAQAAGTSTTPQKGLTAAGFLLGGTLLSLAGLVWDIQWHYDVGPDTFFTLPHLLLYAGSAVAGVASLVVVLAATAADRAGRPVDPAVGGVAVGVFGRTFAAPLGYLVAGVGAALFLVYGLWDQWWHGLYGFDAVLESPPHMGFLLSITLTMTGAVMVSSAARGRGWSAPVTFAGLAVLLGFSTATTNGLSALGGGVVELPAAGMAFMSVLTVVLGAQALDRWGGALAVAGALAAFQAFFWWFAPWATRLYADSLGLPMRDYVTGVPVMPAMMPLCLVLVAGVVELLLARARRRGRPLGRSGLIAGAIGGLAVTVTAPLQAVLLLGAPADGGQGGGGDMGGGTLALILTVVCAGAAGAAAGFLGVRFGDMLRQLAPAREGR